jgi:hypothetical protein
MEFICIVSILLLLGIIESIFLLGKPNSNEKNSVGYTCLFLHVCASVIIVLLTIYTTRHILWRNSNCYIISIILYIFLYNVSNCYSLK